MSPKPVKTKKTRPAKARRKPARLTKEERELKDLVSLINEAMMRGDVRYMLAPAGLFPQGEDELTLAEWWKTILGYGKMPCYAVFLALPNDKTVLRYVKEYGLELEIISGGNCAVIVFDKASKKRKVKSKPWMWGIDETITVRSSGKIAKLFNIPYDELPCLLMFESISSKKRVVFGLRDLSFEDISQEMRAIFAIIDRAVGQNKNVLDKLAHHKRVSSLKTKGRSLVWGAVGVAKETLKTVVEGAIEAAGGGAPH